MALQAGMGLGRIIMILGAGYTSTIMLKNGRLSDLLGDLQILVKGLEKSKDSPSSDAIASQVQRLAQEIQKLYQPPQQVVIHGDPSGNIGSLALPLATLSTLSYGYMWWKGLSFSDLLYVTRHSMATAVSSMTKHLEQVTSALDAAKRHLTQRIQNLDGKLEEQKNISEGIKKQVTDVSDDLSQIGCNLDSLREVVSKMDESVRSLEWKQDITNSGVLYLVDALNARGQTNANFLQDIPSSKPCNYLGLAEASTFGLQTSANCRYISLGNTAN